MKLLFTLALLSCFQLFSAQLAKGKLNDNINAWYEAHPEKYALTIAEGESQAYITRYHPERPEEKNDIIEVEYEGMRIQLKFTKPFEEITTHQDSLQKYLMYVSLTRIYNEIPADGWEIYPRTPSSSLSGKGVTFTAGGESVGLEIKWKTYTVMGYKQTKKCNQELGIEDGSVSDGCYITVKKYLPLEITIKETPLIVTKN